MKAEALSLGPLQTNCYILTSDTAKGKAIVIDPAFHAEQLLSYLSKQSLVVETVLVTHTHFDHMYALDALCNETGARFLCPEKDRLGLSDPTFNGSRTLIKRDLLIRTRPAAYLSDSDMIPLGSERLTVLETPGHTRGSVCYMTEGMLFSGDTLFCGGYGRTDLAGGSKEELAWSLSRILALDGGITVFPGHGRQTTIKNEQQYFGMQ